VKKPSTRRLNTLSYNECPKRYIKFIKNFGVLAQQFSSNDTFTNSETITYISNFVEVSFEEIFWAIMTELSFSAV